MEFVYTKVRPRLGPSLFFFAVIVGGISYALFSRQEKNQTPHENAPRVAVICDRADVGLLNGETTFKVRFKIKNRGTRRLLLSRKAMIHDCGCVNGTNLLTVPAGSTKTLELVLNTEKLEGPFFIKISYRTNDPNKPLVELFIEGSTIHPDQEAVSALSPPRPTGPLRSVLEK